MRLKTDLYYDGVLIAKTTPRGVVDAHGRLLNHLFTVSLEGTIRNAAGEEITPEEAEKLLSDDNDLWERRLKWLNDKE